MVKEETNIDNAHFQVTDMKYRIPSKEYRFNLFYNRASLIISKIDKITVSIKINEFRKKDIYVADPDTAVSWDALP